MRVGQLSHTRWEGCLTDLSDLEAEPAQQASDTVVEIA
jgi:hypothetical protein